MSRGLLFVSAIVGLALGAPQGARDESTTTTTPVPILKQINKVNDDGSYTFGYEAADGTFKVENRDATGKITGRYGYFDETGQLKVVDYVAGNGAGFTASADFLPKSPVPVPVPVASGIEGPDTPAIPLVRLEQAKVEIKKNNANEDFSTDENENGIPDALEGVIPELRSPISAVPAPVAPLQIAPVAPQVTPAQPTLQFRAPAAAPQVRNQPVQPTQVFQQTAPFQSVPTFQQATVPAFRSLPEADPANTFVQQTPQGFQFAFTAPAQPAIPQQARALAAQFPQNHFGHFQQFPQFLQFTPQQ